jgi:hypothetical protein
MHFLQKTPCTAKRLDGGDVAFILSGYLFALPVDFSERVILAGEVVAVAAAATSESE